MANEKNKDAGEATKAAEDKLPSEVSLKPTVGMPGRLPTDTSKSTFELRELPGRDGKGPCKVINRTLMMPNGDIAPIGSTFDPGTEKMTRATYQMLVAKKRISAADREVEDKLFKTETVTKGKTSGGGS